MSYDNPRQNEKEGDPPMDLDLLVRQLVENFLNQLQALNTTEEPFHRNSTVLTAQPMWHLYGQVQIFEDNLTITLMRIWEDSDGLSSFDPRPGHDPRIYINLPFVSSNYSREDWDVITDALHQKICRLPQITYNNQ